METHEPDPSAIFITRTEAARRLGVGVATIQNLIDSGVLESVKFGYRTVRVRASTVTELPSRLASTESSQETESAPTGSTRPAESPGHADDLTS